MSANTDFRLMAILRVAHLVSTGAEHISVRDALTRTGYAGYRPSFGPADIASVLSRHPSLIEEWLAYSEDKRTEAGWYVLRDGEIGQVLKPATQRSYPSIQEAVAQYIVRELDFWADLSSDSDLARP
jgi:hypothetical protein